ncbi:MAG TPA: MBL fold metallo-hydrolase [Terriglobia bacterium]|nr:MBL fold metallo-hydrolase [Terriglobia bacterium]
MRVKFWGVRGSTPTPERRNSRYGGNTPCIEIRLANGTLIVLDCGSGLRGLGKSLLREFGERPIHAYVFLTHFHWDHIQGIPFFLPLYRKGNVFLFHSVLRKGLELRGAVEGQMVNPYFPVDMSVMGSTRHFYDLDEHPINVNGAVISSAPLNHPGECVAYRVEADGAAFVLATDTEPGSAFHDRSVRELAKGADVFVYDAQYTPEQLLGEKKNWGHSSWLEGTRIVQAAGAKRLILFHHDPDHDDLFVDGLVEKSRQEFPQSSGAAEGMVIELPSGAFNFAIPSEASDRRSERRYQLQLPVRLNWKEPDGSQGEAEGTAQDLSSSGLYFVAPPDLRADQPFQVEVVLPDEITHRGEVLLKFVARPVRQELLSGGQSGLDPKLGIAARIESVEEEPSPEPSIPKKSKLY